MGISLSANSVCAGGAVTTVFSHAIASLSEEAQQKYPSFPQPKVDVKVGGVEKLLRRVGGVYTFAGPLAGAVSLTFWPTKTFEQ